MKTFKQFLTENDDIEIHYIGNSDYDFNEDEDTVNTQEASDYAYNLAKRVNLGITRDRDLLAVASYNDEMVGAIWNSFDNEVYTFDIAVEPKYQGKGIGSKLIDYGIQEFESMDYPDATLEFDVTSLISKGALERRGFHVSQKTGQDRWEMKR